MSLDHEQLLAFGMEVGLAPRAGLHAHLNCGAAIVVQTEESELSGSVGIVEPITGLRRYELSTHDGTSSFQPRNSRNDPMN
jgi:hypothetical protein